jgi:ABC-2 type transport system ATP-binding protein
MPVISSHELTYIYRRRWSRGTGVRALDQVSFDVHQGELVGLIGTNGAGKTTLVKCLLGVIVPEQGEVTVFGSSPHDCRIKHQIGYLPEAYPYDRFLTGRTFLEFHAGMGGRSGGDTRRVIDELAGELNLADDLDCSLRHYSKGMCQRLGLIQALMHRPRLLILDEPTDGLDPFGRVALRSLLRRLREVGTTILLNSHILSEVEMICDRVTILHEGRILRSGPVKELTADRGITAIRIDASDRTGVAGLRGNIVLDESNQTCDILVNTPEEVNSILDHLRRQGIRILEVQPRLTSLEEVFLQLVGEGSGKELHA